MPYIIAEVGGNHDGNIDTALTLIDIAKEAGCDAVKFQAYTAEKLVHPEAVALPQAKGYTRQFNRFKDLEFTDQDWQRLISRCKEKGIDFLTTPFDLETLDKFKGHMKYIKISSGDLTYHRLLRAAAETGKHVILSTGMAKLHEIEEAAQFFNPDRLTVCHCVSIYPCPDDEANLGVLDLLSEFKSVGYSDHTKGQIASLVAAGKGCDVIEKHITLDSSRPYGDHPLSLEPHELAEMVSNIRRIEKMMGKDKPAKGEDLARMRRGAYARRPISAGQIITENDIIEIRPFKGVYPQDVIGTRAKQDFKELECLK